MRVRKRLERGTTEQYLDRHSLMKRKLVCDRERRESDIPVEKERRLKLASEAKGKEGE